jgi:Protein of unknown function (DUF3761)/Domain of unknown function (DUF4124)
MTHSLLAAILACLYVPCALAQTSAASAGSVYKCTAADGGVQYTNMQCPQGSESRVVSTYDPSMAKAQAQPYATQADPVWHEHFVAQSTAPPAAAHPAHTTPQASALCNDGTYAYGRGRSACARHGGIERWL